MSTEVTKLLIAVVVLDALVMMVAYQLKKKILNNTKKA